jgi:DNA-binding NarL/FixJ family response regulator
MSPSAVTSHRWLVFTSNTLERTTLARLLGAIGLDVVFAGGLDARAISTARRHAEEAGIVIGLGQRDLADGRARAVFEAFPEAPVILFFRDHAGVPDGFDLPPNVIGTLGADATEDVAAHALSLIRLGYGVLAQDGFALRARPGGAAVARLAPGVLTRREREVAAFICEGASNKEIARRLGLSSNTVNAHVSAILRKLGARNRIEVAIRLSDGAAQAAAHHPQI